MPQGDDLVGLGMPAQLAATLGNTANALTCAGTSQTTAATVKVHNTELVAASSQTGAILPSLALVGTPYWFFTSSSTTAVVYCPVGHNLNGSANGSLSIAQNKGAVIWQYKKSNWASILTA